MDDVEVPFLWLVGLLFKLLFAQMVVALVVGAVGFVVFYAVTNWQNPQQWPRSSWERQGESLETLDPKAFHGELEQRRRAAIEALRNAEPATKR